MKKEGRKQEAKEERKEREFKRRKKESKKKRKKKQKEGKVMEKGRRWQPREEFQLTANSLEAQIETHGKLILRTLSYLIVNSQDDSHCELSVSYL